MIGQIVLIILGFALLIKGADVLVSGAETIAKKFHIPEIIIGLTIVSIGTSMPELFVSVQSAIEGHSDISIGNVIGSNICNLLLILGISAMVREIEFKRETRLIEIPITLVVTIAFYIVANINGSISRIDSIILLILFGLFMAYTIVMGKKGEKFDENDPLIEENPKQIAEKNEQIEKEKLEKDDKLRKRQDTKKIWISILEIVLGIIVLKFGGDLVVHNAEKIALGLHISEKIISLTIIAIGTSLPELVTSVVAAFKGDSDIAIGNILGSCIFNILLIIGLSGVISPMNYDTSYNSQVILLGASTLLLALFPFIGKRNHMTRANGFIYFIIYIGYTIMLIK